MTASRLLTLQITLISLLFVVITIKLFVDHPEWSPNGLIELRTALPHQAAERIRLLATP
jgi:hypothetical protein